MKYGNLSGFGSSVASETLSSCGCLNDVFDDLIDDFDAIEEAGWGSCSYIY